MSKILYLVRGAPGSGKSTFCANYISHASHFEADMYFLKNGVYFFDRNKIKEAHAWCQGAVAREMYLTEHDGAITVSNTFTKLWELEPYIKLAHKHGFRVEIIHLCSMYGNRHGVPKDVVDVHLKGYEPHPLDTNLYDY